MILVFPPPSIGQSDQRDLTGIQVALYAGGPTSESSRESLARMFSWMNASVTVLSGSAIREGELENYDLVVIPGGYAPDFINDIGARGLDQIRNFTSNGGSFIGICAGAYFAADYIIWQGLPTEYRLDLFDGAAVGAIDEIAPWPNYEMCTISVNQNSELIDLSIEPANHTVMYFGGPYFLPNDPNEIEILATYDINDEAAMIAFEYGQGRVFLSGPHPEWEEDSDRDGASWPDGFDDNGSEWNLMLSASLWLIEHVNNPSTVGFQLPYLVGVALLIVGVIGSAVILIHVFRNRVGSGKQFYLRCPKTADSLMFTFVHS
jgi:biotin--protein ligase